jgi:hypothetical protein
MSYVRAGMGRGGGAGPESGFFEQFVQSGATMPIVSEQRLRAGAPCNQAPGGRTTVLRSGGYHYADNVAAERERTRVARQRQILEMERCVRTGRTAHGGTRSTPWNETEYCCPAPLMTPPMLPPGSVPPPTPPPREEPVQARPWYMHPAVLVGSGAIGAIVLVRLVQR